MKGMTAYMFKCSPERNPLVQNWSKGSELFLHLNGSFPGRGREFCGCFGFQRINLLFFALESINKLLFIIFEDSELADWTPTLNSNRNFLCLAKKFGSPKFRFS